MDSIDNNIVQKVAELVVQSNRLANIHTVKIELNGQHGGADVRIDGDPIDTNSGEFHFYGEVH